MTALGSREGFPYLKARSYLNHAAVSPPSSAVEAAAREVLQDYAENGLSAIFRWIPQRLELKQALGSLLGVDHRLIALTPSTTRGLADLALCQDWKKGERVLLFEGEFPANVVPWQYAAWAFGAEPLMLPLDGVESGLFLQRVEDALKQHDVRVLAVSAVQFQTGLRMPLAELADLAHQHDARIAVDAIQAAGVVPLDLGHLDLDYLAGGAHKWLMGLEGVGYVVARAETLTPRVAGWLSVQDPLSFLMEGEGHLSYDKELRDDTDTLELGSTNVVGAAALQAGVEPLLERGFTSERARMPRFRSGILSVKPPPDEDLIALAGALNRAGVSVSTPDGRLRFAPHWCNGLDEVDLVIDALDEYLERTDRL
jgi:cysteine desulfurase/selenocysteine lyase